MTSSGNNVINLNRFRKQKSRAEKEKRAEENREKFGRTKAEKEKDAGEQRKLDEHVEGHKLTPEDDG